MFAHSTRRHALLFNKMTRLQITTQHVYACYVLCVQVLPQFLRKAGSGVSSALASVSAGGGWWWVVLVGGGS